MNSKRIFAGIGIEKEYIKNLWLIIQERDRNKVRINVENTAGSKRAMDRNISVYQRKKRLRIKGNDHILPSLMRGKPARGSASFATPWPHTPPSIA
jgi:hypothetical protein